LSKYWATAMPKFFSLAEVLLLQADSAAHRLAHRTREIAVVVKVLVMAMSLYQGFGPPVLSPCRPAKNLLTSEQNRLSLT
jgi:hypothetical protein